MNTDQSLAMPAQGISKACDWHGDCNSITIGGNAATDAPTEDTDHGSHQATDGLH